MESCEKEDVYYTRESKTRVQNKFQRELIKNPISIVI